MTDTMRTTRMTQMTQETQRTGAVDMLSTLRAIPGLRRAWPGKRDSDPRPRPWQGRALPTELLPHFYSLTGSISLNAFAKVLILFEHPNFLYTFFQKTWRRVPAHAHHIL